MLYALHALIRCLLPREEAASRTDRAIANATTILATCGVPPRISSWHPPDRLSADLPAGPHPQRGLPASLPLSTISRATGSWTGTDMHHRPGRPRGPRARRLPSAHLSEPESKPGRRSIHRLFPQPARRRNASLAPALPARSGLDADREPDALRSPCRATPVSPQTAIVIAKGECPPARALLVLGARPRSRQRILGQVLPGQGFHQDEPQRRRPGARHHYAVPRRDRRRRAAAPSSFRRPKSCRN